MKLLQDKTNVIAPDADYPFGSIKDNPGDQTGTPVNRELLSDVVQFFEKLFDVSGLTANGLPDNDTNGFQLYEALRTLFPVRTKVLNIGAWNMDSTSSVSVAHGLTEANIRSFSVIVQSDTGSQVQKIDSAISNPTPEGSVSIIGANVVVSRVAAGHFDSVDFDSAIINRGYITIEYTD